MENLWNLSPFRSAPARSFYLSPSLSPEFICNPSSVIPKQLKIITDGHKSQSDHTKVHQAELTLVHAVQLSYYEDEMERDGSILQ